MSLGLLTRYGLTRPLTWVEAVPDATFRSALESEGITTLELLQAATSIDLIGYGLTGADWGGIEYATSITFLNLGGTGVSGDLSAVSGLTSLTYLILYDTSVSGAISAVSGLTNLTYLNLNSTSVSGDISGVSGLTNLTYLRLYNTSVSGDLSAVSGLTSLTYLYLFNTSVSGDLSAVSGLTSLTYLNVYNTSVSGATSPTVSTQDSLATIRLYNMALDQAAVDTVLADLVTSLSLPGRVTATVQLQDNAAPSTSGDDDVNTLVSAGWTVTTD